MNASALLIIVIASIGKVSASDIEVITSNLSGKSCAANDGKCVATAIESAKLAVKKARKANKEGGKLWCLTATVS